MPAIVLGAGLVGSAIAADLARDSDTRVTVVDRDAAALEAVRARSPAVTTVRRDLRQTGAVASAVADADLVIGALPGFLGFEALRQVIEAGKDVVDISFFPEDPFRLDALARSRGVTAVVDCGVAPGLSNVLAGHVETLVERVERYLCYVGGLPRRRRWPYEYKAPFSPADVLEEYTRPARLVEHGEEVVRPALSEVELVDLPGVDTLEAFNTDGLRTLLRTLEAPFMKEKTLRYPGHAGLMRVFRESGFLDTEPVEVEGGPVSPRALTSALLFDAWRLAEDEEDFVVMRVVVEGDRAGRRYRYTYDLLDRYDAATGVSAMARTTGYTCTIVARQVARGLYTRAGISPPEYVGRVPACYDDLLAGYEARGITVRERVQSSTP